MTETVEVKDEAEKLTAVAGGWQVGRPGGGALSLA